ncbi:hypothetical protein SJ929_14530, partial [Enterococcus faecium]
IVIPPAIFFYYSTLFDSRFKTLQQNHFGYTWKGMVGISRSLANAFYERNYAVYVLYDDDTESLVDEEYKLDLENVLYGIEKEDLAKYIFSWLGQ